MQRPRTERIKAMDGLRGIAILGVLITHSMLAWWLTPMPVSLDGILSSTGRAGVELFFVLSAFLITGILLDAKGTRGVLGHFYARRALRILPLYYAVLILLLTLQGPGSIAGAEIWYWLHLSNWTMALQGQFASEGYSVIWSLSIEEQFYAIWPFVVLALRPRQLLAVAVAGIVAALVWRAALVFFGYPVVTVITTTPSHFDSLGIGAAIAILARTQDIGLSALVRPARWSLALGLPALIALGVAVGGYQATSWLMQTLGNAMLALTAGASLVLTLATPAHGFVRRITESRFLCTFGRYSYCLYLVHEPVGETVRVIAYAEFWPWLAPIGVAGHLVIWALMVAASLAVAWLSWRYLEAPLLSLKRFVPYKQLALPRPVPL